MLIEKDIITETPYSAEKIELKSNLKKNNFEEAPIDKKDTNDLDNISEIEKKKNNKSIKKSDNFKENYSSEKENNPDSDDSERKAREKDKEKEKEKEKKKKKKHSIKNKTPPHNLLKGNVGNLQEIQTGHPTQQNTNINTQPKSSKRNSEINTGKFSNKPNCNNEIEELQSNFILSKNQNSLGNTMQQRTKKEKESKKSPNKKIKYDEPTMKEKKPKKRRIRFKQPFIEYVNIESYKLYNSLMCFSDPHSEPKEEDFCKKYCKNCNIF